MKYATALSTVILVAISSNTHANATIIETASSTISAKSVAGGKFEYDLTLTNTGNTNLSTFWFAWVPGKDFLSVDPTAETSPAGWNLPNITNGGPNDGFALQWIANTPLAPGATISGFSFTTTESPSIVEGTSAVPAYAGTKTDTAFVYIGQPLTDAGFQLTAAVAPEPASLSLLALGAIPLLSRRKRCT